MWKSFGERPLTAKPQSKPLIHSSSKTKSNMSIFPINSHKRTQNKFTKY